MLVSMTKEQNFIQTLRKPWTFGPWTKQGSEQTFSRKPGAFSSRLFIITLGSSCLVIMLSTLVSTGFFLNIGKNFGDDIGYGCRCFNFSGEIDYSNQSAVFEGKILEIPNLALDMTRDNVLGSVMGDKWIEVDLSEQKLWAREGDNLFMETKISSGLPNTPTPQGVFNIWIKLRATKMEGGQGRYYYNLPNVPYVMFFQNDKVPGWKGYGLHGTYWHNDFGIPHSHGCVNLPTENAKRLYYWVNPVLPEGKNIVYADLQNPGTKIVIHE